MPSSDPHGPNRHDLDELIPTAIHPGARDPDAYDVTERRAAARVVLTASCVLLLHGRRHPAGCLDISEVGLGCIVEPEPGLAEISPDLVVSVQLTLDGDEMELSAVIVRAVAAADGMVVLGMHLRDVSDRHREQIRDLVYARLQVLRASGRL